MLHVGCRLANTARLLATSFAWGCHLWWVVVESSSFASGRAGWALRRLRGWVIRVLQIAECGDAGQRDGRAGAPCAELLGVLERGCCGGVLGGLHFFSSYVALDTSPLRALRARYLPTCRSWRGVASRPTYLPTGARCGPHLIDLRAVRFI